MQHVLGKVGMRSQWQYWAFPTTDNTYTWDNDALGHKLPGHAAGILVVDSNTRGCIGIAFCITVLLSTVSVSQYLDPRIQDTENRDRKGGEVNCRY